MDPTSKNGGLRADVAQMVRAAKNATDQPPSVVKIEILYDFETGRCRVGAPADFCIFMGALEAAKDTFKQMMETAKREAQSKRIHVPDGQMPPEEKQ